MRDIKMCDAISSSCENFFLMSQNKKTDLTNSKSKGEELKNLS